MAIADLPEIKGDSRFVDSVSIPRRDSLVGGSDRGYEKYIFGFSPVIEKSEKTKSNWGSGFEIKLENGMEWFIYMNCKYVVKAELEVK